MDFLFIIKVEEIADNSALSDSDKLNHLITYKQKAESGYDRRIVIDLWTLPVLKIPL